MTAADWFPDPAGTHVGRSRWWDGSGWTAHVRDASAEVAPGAAGASHERGPQGPAARGSAAQPEVVRCDAEPRPEQGLGEPEQLRPEPLAGAPAKRGPALLTRRRFQVVAGAGVLAAAGALAGVALLSGAPATSGGTGIRTDGWGSSAAVTVAPGSPTAAPGRTATDAPSVGPGPAPKSGPVGFGTGVIHTAAVGGAGEPPVAATVFQALLANDYATWAAHAAHTTDPAAAHARFHRATAVAGQRTGWQLQSCGPGMDGPYECVWAVGSARLTLVFPGSSATWVADVTVSG